MKVLAIEPVTDRVEVRCSVERYPEHGILAAVRVHVAATIGVIKIPLCTVCWAELLEQQTGDSTVWLDRDKARELENQQAKVMVTLGLIPQCEQCGEPLDENHLSEHIDWDNY